MRCGGGYNHRFGLDDAVLIKDNHLVAAGGIRPAIERARAGLGHMAKVELEVDTLTQLEEALSLGVDTILLDNMSNADLKRAVNQAKVKPCREASGNVRAAAGWCARIYGDGADYILPEGHHAFCASIDLGLDF